MQKSIHRGISQITSELALEGPKDSFNEVIDMNEELIKKRIQKDLKKEEWILGSYTKTKVRMYWIDSIAKKENLEEVRNRIKKVTIDGILDASYLKKRIKEESIFPTILSTERPDKASMALLEGKIVLMVDNSPNALILPSFFQDFFHTTDDYYENNRDTTIIRLIRVMAFMIAIFTPAIYLSVTTRNYNLIPLKLLITLQSGRNGVPFPAYLEAFLMILSFEILKEGDLRKNNISSSSISILGGLILGDAAVKAGIVSPIMIIVIAISSISGLIFQSIELENTIRFYKIIFLFFSSLLGIIGVLLGISMIIFDLKRTKTLHYNYFSWNQNEWKDSFIKIKTNKRNSDLTDNINRGAYEENRNL